MRLQEKFETITLGSERVNSSESLDGTAAISCLHHQVNANITMSIGVDGPKYARLKFCIVTPACCFCFYVEPQDLFKKLLKPRYLQIYMGFNIYGQNDQYLYISFLDVRSL